MKGLAETAREHLKIVAEIFMEDTIRSFGNDSYCSHGTGVPPTMPSNHGSVPGLRGDEISQRREEMNDYPSQMTATEAVRRLGLNKVKPPEAPCPHQWFEVRKLERHGEHPAERCPMANRGTGGYGWDYSLCIEYDQGVLVKCANCLTSKELWE